LLLDLFLDTIEPTAQKTEDLPPSQRKIVVDMLNDKK